MSDGSSTFQLISSTVQVISVVVGVVISVLSFNTARELEAARPFYTLRQSLYAEAVKAAGVLANPEVHTRDELTKSRTRFRELYVAELSMVEAPAVEAKMKALAGQIDPDLLAMTKAQAAAYDLAHALRDTFAHAWKAVEK